MQHFAMVSVGVLQVLAVRLLKYGELQDQEHRCAAAVQDFQGMHLHTQRNAFAWYQATMSVATSVVPATTHQHCVSEVALKLAAYVGLVAHIILYMKADLFPERNHLGEETIHGVGVLTTASQSTVLMLLSCVINMQMVV